MLLFELKLLLLVECRHLLDFLHRRRVDIFDLLLDQGFFGEAGLSGSLGALLGLELLLQRSVLLGYTFVLLALAGLLAVFVGTRVLLFVPALAACTRL